MKIGILGATGAVGRQMLECIEEQNLAVEELRLFSSPRSTGRVLSFRGEGITVQVVDEQSFEGLDYVLGAVSNALTKEYLPLIQKAKAVLIDNSSAFRLQDDVPLVVPEINGEDAFDHHGIISNPNCSTIIALMAIAPIHRLSKIKHVNATTFQAVSGAGVEGMRELREQILQLDKGEEVHPNVFPAQIAYNCIAQIGTYLDDGYTTEEVKMHNEGRKIMHAKDLQVNCTCVRVPVYRSHSISLTVETEQEVSLDAIRQAIKNFPGVELIEDHVPAPVEASNQDIVYVGRVRKDISRENSISLWCCGDQIRKGAASNAVSIMTYLEKSR
ncbi:aspartate-semialdehyde dehydrogenase [Solobacterium moorei]|uniref:aspartate-semialdehyde dehydrogenase n=1 Tax=Solobacterium moorei TaxID=102148 RepID=UPI00041FBE95|nr:aspartate-semialdehyde dehydrogenase [Solobacterium moorei]BET20708.1 aspartate-semialdehyde dehydrogenase [Solobacterium moorei]